MLTKESIVRGVRILPGGGGGNTDDVSKFFQDVPEGTYDFVLPFIILFAVFFGLLQEIGITGSDNDAVDAVIAGAMAFYVTTSMQFGNWMQDFIPQYGLWLVFGIVVAMAAQMGGVDLGDYQYFAYAMGIGAAYLIYVEEGYSTVFEDFPIPFMDDIDPQAAVILLATAGVVIFIYKRSHNNNP